jgi:hypothetical protein
MFPPTWRFRRFSALRAGFLYQIPAQRLKAGNWEMGPKELRAALKQDPNLPKTEMGW